MNAMPGPLIDAESLSRELAAQPPPVLLDVRWRLGGPPGIDSYHRGHLPGAVFVDLDTELAGPPGAGGRHPLPQPAVFEAVMRRAGLRPGLPVVAYDDGDATVAARAWWTLRYFGHDQVRVLDGGIRAWTAAGLPVTTESPAVVPADATEPAFTARPGQLPVLDGPAAAALARSGVLLDARAAARYRGDSEPVDPVAGHIPAAISAPTSENIGPDGRLRSPAELRDRFAPPPASGPARKSAPTAGRVSPPHTKFSRSNWRACPPPCT
jgi:thiosulfate/3-mercaptopyruvate sulfurtransferase